MHQELSTRDSYEIVKEILLSAGTVTRHGRGKPMSMSRDFTKRGKN